MDQNCEKSNNLPPSYCFLKYAYLGIVCHLGFDHKSVFTVSRPSQTQTATVGCVKF